MDTCGLWVGCGWGGGAVGGVGNAPPVYGATARRLAWCPCRPGARACGHAGMRACGHAGRGRSWVLQLGAGTTGGSWKSCACSKHSGLSLSRRRNRCWEGKGCQAGEDASRCLWMQRPTLPACLPACLALRAAPTTKIMCACTSQPYLVSVRERSLLMFQGPAGKMEEPRSLGDQGAGSQPTWAWAGGRERGGGRNSVCSTTPVM